MTTKPMDKKGVEALETFCRFLIKRHGPAIVSLWLIKTETRDLCVMVLINDMKASADRSSKIKADAASAEKAIGRNLGVKIHSGFYELSGYFESVMKGDEKVFDEIRHSVPVYDPTGFFEPLKKLVQSGRIVGTEESLFKLVFDVKERFRDVERLKMRVLDTVYAAMIDSAQAALVSVGVSFPVHRDVAEQLRKNFVRKHKLEKRYVDYCEEVVGFIKSVEHGKVKAVMGRELDDFVRKGNLFVARMRDLVEEIEKSK